MIDDTPYIIVDNQRLSPIERSSRSNRETVDRAGGEELTFGVVDRVTISSAAREKARQLQFQSDAAPPALENLALRQPPTRPLLSYFPKRLR